MEEKRAEWEGHCSVCHLCEAAHELKDGLKRRVPEAFWEHRRAARRESLLALRSLLDAALAATEPRPAHKATRIKVE